MQRKTPQTAKRAATRINPRARAARVVEEVLVRSRYLDAALTDAAGAAAPRAAALSQETS